MFVNILIFFTFFKTLAALILVVLFILMKNVLTRRREYGTYLATARRHRRRIKMQKRDE